MTSLSLWMGSVVVGGGRKRLPGNSRFTTNRPSRERQNWSEADRTVVGTHIPSLPVCER